jgi:hypothetical protein
VALQPLDSLPVGQRREEADQDGARRERGDLIRGRSAHAYDDLGAFEDGADLAQHRTRVRVLLVGESGRRSGTALDRDLEAVGGKTRDCLGYERDAALAGGGFTWNCDAHSKNLREGIFVRGRNHDLR